MPCESVHTFFMKFPIDLVYLDKKRKVRKVRHAVPAWRLSACLTAHSIIELPAGTVEKTGTQAGDELSIETLNHEIRPIRVLLAAGAAVSVSCVHRLEHADVCPASAP